MHCKNKIVKIKNLLVSTFARNNLNCNLIGRVGFYGYTLILSVISISLRCLLDAQSRMFNLIEPF